MPISPDRHVGEMAATIPGAIEAFRSVGVDCCRDARLTLDQVSLRTGVRPARLLLRARPDASRSLPDWREAPLRTLTRHIAETLHPAAIGAMETLSLRLAEMAQSFPHEWSLGEIRSAFAEVANNLVIHVWRVENEVFPLLESLEADQSGTVPRLTRDDFPDPHDPMLEGLRRLRTLTQDYSLPSQPPEMLDLLGELRDFDDVLHRHIHVEHHVLYPRASAFCACPLSGTEPTGVLTWV